MSAELWRQWGGRLASLRDLSARPAFYAAFTLLIGLATYLYALPALGYYWDDWEVVFLLEAGDPGLFAGYFAFDRPFAWPYQVMYAVFGLNAAAWHIATLLLRWGGILLLCCALAEVWPRQRSYWQWLSILMLVYPGYLQQTISAAYFRHFTAFFLFAVSICLMLVTARRDRLSWPLALGAWVTSFVHVFTIEYFVGLELIRPVLLWLLVRRQAATTAAAIRRTAVLEMPYLLVLVGYFWWRLVVFPSTIPIANYAGDFRFLADFNVSFLSGLLAVLTRATLDLMFATLQVWLSVLGDPNAWTFQGKIAWFASGLGVLLALAFAYFYDFRSGAEGRESMVPRSMVVFGLWAFVVGTLPIWLTSKQLSAQGRWDDRFALGSMLGALVVVICLVGGLIRRPAQRALLAVLLGLSITTQVLVVNRYRLDWAVQNAYYWQLSWRIPALEPGTAIISFEQPSGSIPGYDASFALNLLFHGDPGAGSVPYWFFTNDRFLNFDLQPEERISYKDRNLKFIGNTSAAIAIVHQGEHRCLQVLDAVYADQPFYAANQERLVSISNVSRIRRESVGAPSRQIFGSEPSRTWCYYFQKADLARQYGDWDQVLSLEGEAAATGVSPEFGPELIPFIEAHAQRGSWQVALERTREAQALISEMEPLLCSTWNRFSRFPAADGRTVRAALEMLSCTDS